MSKLLMGQGKVWDEARKIGDCSNITGGAIGILRFLSLKFKISYYGS